MKEHRILLTLLLSLFLVIPAAARQNRGALT